jgi:hypothetical protein
LADNGHRTNNREGRSNIPLFKQSAAGNSRRRGIRSDFNRAYGASLEGETVLRWCRGSALSHGWHERLSMENADSKGDLYWHICRYYCLQRTILLGSFIERVARMSAAICGDGPSPRMSLRSSGLRLLFFPTAKHRFPMHCHRFLLIAITACLPNAYRRASAEDCV